MPADVAEKNKKAEGCCCGASDWKRFDAVLDKYMGRGSQIIAALRECQEINGYLSEELIIYISRYLRIPLSEVFGVASFYSLFSFSPKGRNTIRLCMGTACYVRGIKEINDRIVSEYGIGPSGISEDGRFGLEHVRCLGACSLAPVMMVNDDTHGAVTADKLRVILAEYSYGLRI